MRTIQVTSPKIMHDCKFLFTKRSYKVLPLKILEITNVIVTSDGISFQKSEIIKESVQAYNDKIKIFELSGRLQLKTKPTINLQNENKYLLVFHPWINYYHWLTESIPRIWLVRDILHNCVLLLPESYKNFKYVQDSLSPFKFKNIEYFSDSHNVKIRNAVIPQIKPVCSDYYPEIVNDIRRFFIEFALMNSRSDEINEERLYVIRGNSSRRKIINENELIEILDKFSFQPIDATTFSFFDQVALSHQTQFLISNGSGLTNMHFMRSGTSVMELKKRITNLNDFHDRVLWHLASALNINYYYFFCDPVNKSEDLYHADLKINLNELKKSMKKFCDS